MASISFKNVSKRFGDTLALDNVSFDVEDNAFFCLFGPPLCGKSTILKIILGLIDPDEGEVLIDGRSVAGVAPAQRNIAMVFQNLALFPHMSAEQNVRFPLAERRVDPLEISNRVAEVAEKLNITHILSKPPSQLSGGERQRVAIARALVRDPNAYLMDDPISALDARLREQTRVELRRIQQELGKTLVYVTHDQEEAMSVADTMAIMEDGKIRQTGTPVDLYDSPNSTYVAKMLGSPAMNILPLDFAGKGKPISFSGNTPKTAISIGIRPEDLEIKLAKPSNGASVVNVEPLGSFTTLMLDTGGKQLLATLRGQTEIQTGDHVTIKVNPERAHFFDKSGAAAQAAG
ncbi:MAG: ABC transporter ATP-binding protein [Rhizobiaceae bacterium]|nr:ABC transporter ATP-binding protein [Rhizobiaceae bacterium]